MHNKPIFFEDGKRVSFDRGIELLNMGWFGAAIELKGWLIDNGYKDKIREDNAC